MFLNIYEIIEYYNAYFNSEDASMIEDNWFECQKDSAMCVESSRDKSYLNDEDYEDYINGNINMCIDNTIKYCSEEL